MRCDVGKMHEINTKATLDNNSYSIKWPVSPHHSVSKRVTHVWSHATRRHHIHIHVHVATHGPPWWPSHDHISGAPHHVVAHHGPRHHVRPRTSHHSCFMVQERDKRKEKKIQLHHITLNAQQLTSSLYIFNKDTNKFSLLNLKNHFNLRKPHASPP